MRSLWFLIALAGALCVGAPLHAQTQGPQDPCFSTKKINVPIATAAATTLLVAGQAGTRIFVCGFNIVVPSAVSVSLTEGTGALCNTASQAGVIGVAENGTAANGMALPANGGIAADSNSSVAQTATPGNNLCLFQSGTAQLAGNLMYAQVQQ